MRRKVELLIMLLVLIPSAKAQVMPPSTYQAFLKRMDMSASRWQEPFAALTAADLSVSSSAGGVISGNRELGIGNIGVIHERIRRELLHPRLSNEISIRDALADIISALESIPQFLPDTPRSTRWIEQATPITKDIAAYRGALQTHVSSYADQLQEKAERCSP